MSYGADEPVPVVSSTLRSPWEAISASPSPSPGSGLPSSVSELTAAGDPAIQLAPEVEVGNVEYKLKLLSPTPERFTRLVTQLKWRLLAGSGQALYEIGVSDSGQLIGLTRKDLDESLDTLERMAGELGATLIVQKEIIIPSSPLNLNVLDYGQVDGAPRIPRLASPPAIHDADVSPLSLTDAEGSSSDDIAGTTRLPKSKAQRPNHVAIAVGRSTAIPVMARSSPQPIIRDYPYGFNAWGYSRTPSSSQFSASSPPGTSASLPTFSEADSDVDDDAAFTFDLDINNFSSRSSASASNTVIISEIPDDRFSASQESKQSHGHRLHRQLKHKKPKMLPPPTLDPVEKARQRRARRESNREGRQPDVVNSDCLLPTVLVADSIQPIGGSRDGIGLDTGSSSEDVIAKGKVRSEDILGTSLAGTPQSFSSTRFTLSDDISSEDIGLSDGASPAIEEDASAPRLIAEALIVRKFTVEVEEPYLEFDKLRL